MSAFQHFVTEDNQQITLQRTFSKMLFLIYICILPGECMDIYTANSSNLSASNGYYEENSLTYSSQYNLSNDGIIFSHEIETCSVRQSYHLYDIWQNKDSYTKSKNKPYLTQDFTESIYKCDALQFNAKNAKIKIKAIELYKSPLILSSTEIPSVMHQSMYCDKRISRYIHDRNIMYDDCNKPISTYQTAINSSLHSIVTMDEFVLNNECIGNKRGSINNVTRYMGCPWITGYNGEYFYNNTILMMLINDINIQPNSVDLKEIKFSKYIRPNPRNDKYGPSNHENLKQNMRNDFDDANANITNNITPNPFRNSTYGGDASVDSKSIYISSLAKIFTLQQKNIISEIYSSNGSINCWIGLHKNRNNNHWYWIQNNMTTNFSKWSNISCPNSKHCVEMTANYKYNDEWNKISFSKLRYPICNDPLISNDLLTPPRMEFNLNRKTLHEQKILCAEHNNNTCFIHQNSSEWLNIEIECHPNYSHITVYDTDQPIIHCTKNPTKTATRDPDPTYNPTNGARNHSIMIMTQIQHQIILQSAITRPNPTKHHLLNDTTVYPIYYPVVYPDPKQEVNPTICSASHSILVPSYNFNSMSTAAVLPTNNPIFNLFTNNSTIYPTTPIIYAQFYAFLFSIVYTVWVFIWALIYFVSIPMVAFPKHKNGSLNHVIRPSSKVNYLSYVYDYFLDFVFCRKLPKWNQSLESFCLSTRTASLTLATSTESVLTKLTEFVNCWNQQPKRTCIHLSNIIRCFEQNNINCSYFTNHKQKTFITLLKNECNIKKSAASALWKHFRHFVDEQNHQITIGSLVTKLIPTSNERDNVLRFLMDKKQFKMVMIETTWSNIHVFAAMNNTEAVITLSLDTMEFMKHCMDFVNNHTINLIPIVTFDNDKRDQHHMEYVWIVRMMGNDIGISFAYNDNVILAKAIYLNKEYIHRQNALIVPQHRYLGLDNFTSNINDLEIFDMDEIKMM